MQAQEAENIKRVTGLLLKALKAVNPLSCLQTGQEVPGIQLPRVAIHSGGGLSSYEAAFELVAHAPIRTKVNLAIYLARLMYLLLWSAVGILLGVNRHWLTPPQ